MNNKILEDELHISLYIIIYKFILGFVELVLGLGILLIGNKIFEFYQTFKSQELFEDPHDILASVLEKVLPFFWANKGYIILILIILGVIKMAGAIGLFYHKHWGLDLLVGLTFIVLPFEAFSLLTHPSLPKLIFLLINILIALYLVEFQPKGYFIKFKGRISGRKS